MNKNVELFEYSLTKPEPLLEEAYKKGELVITDSKYTKNELMMRNEKLIDIITTFKTLDGQLTEDQEKNLIDEVIDLTFNTTEKMNYTPFSQYFLVCDVSYSLMKGQNLEDKRKILKTIIREFIKDRHLIYSSHGYSNIVLQVMSDSYSHKRNGGSGRLKVERQIKSRGLEKFRKGTDYTGNYYLLIDGDKKEFLKILKAKSIDFEWAESKQGKIPDVMICYNGVSYIIEHKHMKEGGGGQDKQDTEIVDLIRYSVPEVSFVTYLDGNYFNLIAENQGNGKALTLRKNIEKALESNKDNYFLNTAGFERFLDEVVVS